MVLSFIILSSAFNIVRIRPISKNFHCNRNLYVFCITESTRSFEPIITVQLCLPVWLCYNSQSTRNQLQFILNCVFTHMYVSPANKLLFIINSSRSETAIPFFTSTYWEHMHYPKISVYIPFACFDWHISCQFIINLSFLGK